jgi:hypothetical protein
VSDTSSTTATTSFSLPITQTVADVTSSQNIDDNPGKDDPERITGEEETKSLHTLKTQGNPNLEKYSPQPFKTSKRSKIENADEDGEDRDGEDEVVEMKVKTAKHHGKTPSAESLMADLLREKKKLIEAQKKKKKLKCHQKCELPMSYNQCAIPRCYYKHGAIKRLCFLLCHKQQKKCRTVCEEE